jgi:hypothetical protein
MAHCVDIQELTRNSQIYRLHITNPKALKAMDDLLNTKLTQTFG